MGVILGIDPGTNVMGYGIIDSVKNKMSCLAVGVLELSKVGDPYLKLKMIFDRVSSLISGYNPQALAIEAQFYSKNAQSMLKLGRAQGVAIAAAVSKGLSVTEYEPRKIKMSVTGYGNATKEQVAAMLARMLNLTELPDKLDATDALAAAVCHHYQLQLPMGIAAGAKSWKAFINQHPDRVK